VHPQTEPKKLAPDVAIPVRPPRTGVNTATGVRGLGVEEVVVLEVRIMNVSSQSAARFSQSAALEGIAQSARGIGAICGRQLHPKWNTAYRILGVSKTRLSSEE